MKSAVEFLDSNGITQNPYDDFLAQFGVKGMRWGHRGTPEQLASARKATKIEVKSNGTAIVRNGVAWQRMMVMRDAKENPSKYNLKPGTKVQVEGRLMDNTTFLQLVGNGVLNQTDAQDEFLEHYGIKGMRWGYRRAQELSGGLDPITKPKGGVSEEAARYAQLKRKLETTGPRSMTNAEFKEFNARAKLEEGYIKYKKENPSAKRRAANFAGTLALEVGKEVLAGQGNHPLIKVAQGFKQTQSKRAASPENQARVKAEQERRAKRDNERAAKKGKAKDFAKTAAAAGYQRAKKAREGQRRPTPQPNPNAGSSARRQNEPRTARARRTRRDGTVYDVSSL